jgi:flotillin
MELITMGILGGVGILTAVGTLVAVSLRRVVPTNEVHIIQSSKSTISYGNATEHGNTYYEWPSSIPVIGIVKTIMPVSNFDVDLKAYESYDEDRLPFVVDVKAFFRIADSNVAANRVANFEELLNQLTAIVQGAVRSVLASHSLEEIMQGRGKFGDAFTGEVREQLKSWGVEAVKNIELMDIRDHKDSKVIANIMEKKKSQVESESRIAVAKNHRDADIAEIEAKRETDLQAQEASQQVGLRTVEAERLVALQQESKTQAVKEQQRTTKEKEMAVLKTEQVAKAQIASEVAQVQAEQERKTAIIGAEAQKQTLTLNAEGALEAKKREAEGIAAEGKAKADAQEAMLLAPVNAQTTLAKEIGVNESYQKYLISIEKIKAEQAVGMEQAKALQAAEVKIISNSGKPNEGLKGVMDLFSSQGGTEIGAMLEGLANTDKGQELLGKFLGGKKSSGADNSPLNGSKS